MEEIKIVNIDKNILEECIDLYIDTFSKEPWNEVYDSRNQVVTFFNNHIANNYFLGYACVCNGNVIAISLGMIKPWIEGLEYYIDEFCVSYNMQGKGIGSKFLALIEEENFKKDIKGFLLNTDEDYLAYNFYIKNGFKRLGNSVVLCK